MTVTKMVCTRGTSNKFYTVIQSANRVRVKWGRIERKGTHKTMVEILDNRTEAVEYFEAKVYSKLQRGYRLVA